MPEKARLSDVLPSRIDTRGIQGTVRELLKQRISPDEIKTALNTIERVSYFFFGQSSSPQIYALQRHQPTKLHHFYEAHVMGIKEGERDIDNIRIYINERGRLRDKIHVHPRPPQQP